MTIFSGLLIIKLNEGLLKAGKDLVYPHEDEPKKKGGVFGSSTPSGFASTAVLVFPYRPNWPVFTHFIPKIDQKSEARPLRT